MPRQAADTEKMLLSLASKWETSFKVRWKAQVRRWSESGDITGIIEALQRGEQSPVLLRRIAALKLPAPLVQSFLVDAQLAANKATLDAYGWNAKAQMHHYMEQYAASRVGELSAAAQRSMRRTILNGFDQGMTSDQLARELRTSLHLDERGRIALDNYRKALAKNPGMSIGRQRGLVSEYKDRLVLHRAQTIARTEVMGALNRGHRLSYLAALRDGLLDSTDKVKWITAQDEKTCSICAPLNGKTAMIGEAWPTAAGPVYDPPAHPNCRCTTTLALDAP